MPSSVASALIAFGAVLTAVSATAGAGVAGLGVLLELGLVYLAGLERV